MLVVLGILGVVVFMTIGILGTWAASMRAKRAQEMPLVAAQAGLGFSEFDVFNTTAAPFDLFRQGDGRRIRNIMWKEEPGHPRVFEYGFYRVHKDKNGAEYQTWQWFGCALAQHNGNWPELHVTKERLLDRAAQTLGLPDIELESEEFNRTYVVQCKDPKFATDLLDPQMMEFVLGTGGLVNFATKGRFLLVITSQIDTAAAMVGLLGVAEGFVTRVPPLVWDLYGRFPDAAGTEEMPPAPGPRAEDSDLLGGPYQPGVDPFEFAPTPRLDHLDEAWDPTPDVDYDLDGHPVHEVEEDPWGDGRSRAP